MFAKWFFQAMPPDFFVLAGFLGSGKTTLLLDFLRQSTAGETAVIVNDVGEINIDGAIVSGIEGGLDMATLQDGCVCCSLGNDLLFTIEALLAQRAASGRPPFCRIVLECSGLSRPGKIISTLRNLAVSGFRLSVLSTFDCTNNPLAGVGFDDAAAQLTAARKIILTKLDRVDAGGRERAREAVRSINPLATILCEPDPQRRALAAFTLDDAVEIPDFADITTPAALDHRRIEIFLARFAVPPTWPDLSDWLENFAGALGDRLLRVKGIVRLSDCPEPVLLQAVGTSFSQPLLMKNAMPADSALVIIARDTGMDELRAVVPVLGMVFSRSRDRRRTLICT
jgi:G3E family GTPase